MNQCNITMVCIISLLFSPITNETSEKSQPWRQHFQIWHGSQDMCYRWPESFWSLVSRVELCYDAYITLAATQHILASELLCCVPVHGSRDLSWVVQRDSAQGAGSASIENLLNHPAHDLLNDYCSFTTHSYVSASYESRTFYCLCAIA